MFVWLFRIFIFWYICGFVLLTFDLIPPPLQWANSVFLILAGSIGSIYFIQVYGKIRGVSYSLFVIFLSILVEHLGVKYQIWFGNYYYEKDFGLMIGDVPITIGFAWLMVIAGTHELSYTFVSSIQSFKYVFFVFIGSLLAVAMDLILDPVAFHVKQYWLWTDGGIYYDIPFSNFTGWFWLAMVFHIVGAMLLSFRNKQSDWGFRVILVFFSIYFMFIWLALINQLILAVFINTLLLLACIYLYLKKTRSNL